MQIGSRFSNYALTGAFFFVLHFLFLVVFNEHITLEKWREWVTVADSNLFPAAYQGSVEALLTVFGIISIFFIGLILDLLGSYFFLMERLVFIQHLKKNDDWLSQLLRQGCGVLYRDYKYLQEGKNIVVWNIKEMREMICNHGAINHLQAYFFSYIHINAGGSVSNLLDDNRNLWRVSRAIANTLILLSLEVIIIGVHVNVFGEKVSASIVLLFMFIVAAFITLQSYNRVCYSMFSMVFTALKNKT